MIVLLSTSTPGRGVLQWKSSCAKIFREKMPLKEVRAKKKTLKVNHSPARLLMQKLLHGDLTGDEKHEEVYKSDPVLSQYTSNSVRVCWRKLKVEYFENRKNGKQHVHVPLYLNLTLNSLLTY